jgi:hypothetical protein
MIARDISRAKPRPMWSAVSVRSNFEVWSSTFELLHHLPEALQIEQRRRPVRHIQKKPLPVG